MTNLPKVSVVMSVYNGEAFLAEAIDSILNQTFGDFEFIIVDDGSTDKTAEMLSAYESRDSRIRTIHQENKGRTPSLNIGIGLANAKYIARMDADDIALPDRFQVQFDFLEAHPEVGLLGGAVQLIDHTGRVFDSVFPPASDAEIKSTILRYNPFWHPTTIMRKDIVLLAGQYRPTFDESEDYDLFLRIGERCKVRNLSGIVLRYRIHSGQASMRKRRHQVECVLAAAAASSIRKRGLPDPLSEAERIDLQLMNSLGVTPAQVRQALTDSYTHWIRLLQNVDDEAALDCMLQFANNSLLNHGTRAEAFLSAASALYRKNRRRKALVSAARAVLLKPSLTTLIAKRGLARLAMPTGT